MAKLTLTDIVTGHASASALNDNNALIEAALENTLSRDGTSPNQMNAVIDMNGYNINNLGNPITIVGWEWEGPWLTSTAYTVGDVVENGGSAYICIVAHTSGTFSTDLAAVKWQLVASASLPSQSGHSGKYLTTNGTTASWEDASTLYALLAGDTFTGAIVTVGITDTGIIDFSGATLAGGTPLVFEGATENAFETSLVITDPTADRTLTMPDADVDLTNVRQANTSQSGYVEELATTAEVKTGTSTTKVVTVEAMRQGLWDYGTLWASTSGTSNTWGSLPSWATTYHLILDRVSLNNAESLKVQLGDSGGLHTSGYAQAGSRHSGGGNAVDLSTDGFIIHNLTATNNVSGILTITLIDPATFTYSVSGCFSMAGSNEIGFTAGSVVLDTVLTQVKLMSDSTGTFDNGSANIKWQ